MKLFNKLKFIVGMPFFGILLLILIIAMAMATFVESAQDTNTAWALIYDSWWFELIFALVVVNLVGVIIRQKLYKRSKIAVLIFHISFLLMIVGGAITRYTSTEGMMHIREGKVSSTIISNSTYMDIVVEEGETVDETTKKVRLSAATPNRFNWKTKVNGKTLKVKSVDYIMNAAIQYVGAPGGEPYLQMMLLAGRQMSVGLSSGEVNQYPGLTVSFNNPEAETELKIFSGDSGLVAVSPHPVAITSMGGDGNSVYPANEPFMLEQGKLFAIGEVRFALQRYMPSAKMQFVNAGEGGHGSGMDVTRLEIDLDGMKSELYLQGRRNVAGVPASVTMGSTTVTATYGSHDLHLPFVLRLEDFRVDRYPGSMSPSSFESDVVLIDMENSINEEHNIYMNNVLKHRGYRFYQSSYDQDELGTILSVKKDFIGTAISYFGYFLLTVGMLMALIMKGTRFSAIARSTGSKAAKAAILILFMLGGSTLFAQNYPAPSKEDAAEFSKLWVQGKEGRFKPMNTLSNEVMRKVIKKGNFDGKNADQVMLGMIVFPDQWKNAPIFEVENATLHQMMGYKGTKVCFNDFLSEGGYILSNLVNDAYNKAVHDRDDLDKEVMKLDEKINVFYMVQTGAMLKIFPDPQAKDQKWLAVSELLDDDFTVTDTLGQVFLLYTKALREGDRALANEIVSFISNYQEQNSQSELSEGKKKGEILYNKLKIFNRLTRIYLTFGLMMLVLQLLKLFKPRKWVDYIFRINIIHVIAFFGVHTIFFGLRWYVSGHAPLSNGYESMIFVSWITLLSGIIFARRTAWAITLTTILAGLSLLVANMSWMNPDITNLVPVLKSPWLTIHVTVIMAGYGFLGLSMLMGLLSVVFFAVMGKHTKDKFLGVINDVSKINHLAVIIGLYLLTIGTFLGAVWANESWGRYWGWDPKETWALISVLVYAFITHMHRFPGMKGQYAFSLATLFGYFSILMTYFGVNYFLGGNHSYAGGAAFSIPFWVYLTVITLFIVSYLAYNKSKKFLPHNTDES